MHQTMWYYHVGALPARAQQLMKYLFELTRRDAHLSGDRREGKVTTPLPRELTRTSVALKSTWRVAESSHRDPATRGARHARLVNAYGPVPTHFLLTAAPQPTQGAPSLLACFWPS